MLSLILRTIDEIIANENKVNVKVNVKAKQEVKEDKKDPDLRRDDGGGKESL